MKETEYARVTFVGMTQVWGFSTRTLNEKHVKLVRVTGDGRDDLQVTKAGKPLCEVPWVRIASAEPALRAAAKKKPEKVPAE